MISTRLNVKKVEFASIRFSKALDEFLSIQMRKAVRAWLRAMAQNNVIPVYSGMSRASLSVISKLPLMSNVARIRSTPVVNFSKDRGIRFNDPIAAGESLSFANISYNKTNYEFVWATSVPQFVTNELTSGLGVPPLHKQTPWGSMSVGAAAFYGYLIPAIRNKRPNIWQYFVVKK